MACAAALVLLVGAVATVSLLSAGDTLTATAAPPGAARFVPVTPTRLLDTREGVGGLEGAFPDNADAVLTVAGRAGVPFDAVAVALNLTATNATAPGFVTAWPAGEPQPTVSNLNVEAAGQTIANFAVVRLGVGGQINLYAYRSLHLIADVTGYWVPAASATAGRFIGAGPARILDTRQGIGAPAGQTAAGSTVELTVAGHGGVPLTGVSAVILNVTTTNAGAAGYVTAWPTGQPQPLASSVNIERAGQTIPNLAVVPIGTGGKVSLYTFSSMDLIADVFGYFTDASAPPSEDGLFVPVTPARILDTRTTSQNGGLYKFIPADRRSDLQVTGRGGVPATGVAAVIANITATNPAAAGFVTVYPAATAAPLASNLNVDRAGQTIPNLAIAQLGFEGRASFVSYSQVDLLVDVAGWFTGALTPPTPGIPVDPPPPVTTTTSTSAPPPSSSTSSSIVTTTTTPPSNCDPSYPTVCIPPPPPYLDCPDIPYTNFTVLPPDPHGFDGNHNGVGCE